MMAVKMAKTDFEYVLPYESNLRLFGTKMDEKLRGKAHFWQFTYCTGKRLKPFQNTARNKQEQGV